MTGAFSNFRFLWIIQDLAWIFWTVPGWSWISNKNKINIYQRINIIVHKHMHIYVQISNAIMGLLRRCKAVRMPSPQWGDGSFCQNSWYQQAWQTLYALYSGHLRGWRLFSCLNHLVCVMAGIQGLNWGPQKLKVSTCGLSGKSYTLDQRALISCLYFCHQLISDLWIWAALESSWGNAWTIGELFKPFKELLSFKNRLCDQASCFITVIQCSGCRGYSVRGNCDK